MNSFCVLAVLVAPFVLPALGSAERWTRPPADGEPSLAVIGDPGRREFSSTTPAVLRDLGYRVRVVWSVPPADPTVLRLLPTLLVAAEAKQIAVDGEPASSAGNRLTRHFRQNSGSGDTIALCSSARRHSAAIGLGHCWAAERSVCPHAPLTTSARSPDRRSPPPGRGGGTGRRDA